MSEELALLKTRATTMGIKFAANIGVEGMKKKIQDTLDGNTTDDDDDETEGESPNEKRMRLNREARVLRRVRITCMNPNKKAMEGEIFTVSNRAVGTIKRFVPFDNEEGWHVEDMILKMIKDRKFQSFFNKKVGKQTIRTGKLVNEFAIEMLEPLTQKQLTELARRQAMSKGAEE
jgi:hypothetical protein